MKIRSLAAWLLAFFITTTISAQNCGVYFNGSSSAYIQASNTSINNFTISFWFRATGAGPMFSSANDSVGLSGVGDKRIYFDATGTLYAGVYNGGTHIINSNMMLLDSTCHHVALTQDGAGIRLYIDGVLKGSLPYSSTDQTSSPPFYWTLGHQYMIGDWQPQPPSYYFAGDMDELTIWNKAFSGAGITDTLVQLNYSGTDPNLQWYYNFNNCGYVSSPGQGQFADPVYYKNGVLPITSTCPATTVALTTGAVTGSPFCAGSTTSVSYTSTASFTSGNIFTVQLSDSNGSFALPVNIGDSVTTADTGYIFVTIPAGTPAGNNYKVRVTSSSPSIIGATSVSTIVINATVTPTDTISTTSQNICAGTPVTFNATATNAGASPVFQWTRNGMPVGTNSNSYTDSSVTNHDAITCIMISSASCAAPDTLLSNTSVMKVNTAYAGIISAVKDTLCAGDVVHLSVTGAIDSTLEWQSAPLAGSFADITGADTTIYQSPETQSMNFRVVATSGTCTDTSALFQLVVNPLPAHPFLSPNDTLICSSDSAKITATIGFDSYHWNTGDTTSYTYAKNAGGYWVTVTDANKCSVVSGHITVAVFPVPSVSIDVQGDTLSSFGDEDYHWMFDGNLIPGATSSVYVATQTGDYAIEVTDTNGCSSVSNSVHIIITGVLNLSEAKDIRISPNPSSTGKWQLAVSNDLLNAEMEIFDDEGRMIYNSKIRNLKSEINLDVAPGVYLLHIHSLQYNVTRKLAKL